MDYIKDQTVNSYNAEIVEEFSTPEKRQEVAERVVNTLFKPTSSVEFFGLKEFDRMGTDDNIPPSIYWTYVFTVKSMGHVYQTITLSSYGGMEFNFHSLTIKRFNLAMSVKSV